jgi:peptidoglycan hydrolase-like protein with peptidoglycan-binding domain
VDFTGNFFGMTLKAVKNFKTFYGISPVLGIVGPLTIAKLNELFGS